MSHQVKSNQANLTGKLFYDQETQALTLVCINHSNDPVFYSLKFPDVTSSVVDLMVGKRVNVKGVFLSARKIKVKEITEV